MSKNQIVTGANHTEVVSRLMVFDKSATSWTTCSCCKPPYGPERGEPQDDTVGPGQQVGARHGPELPARRRRLLIQELLHAEVTDLVDAEPHQRAAGRTTYRNGYRNREWDPHVGTLELPERGALLTARLRVPIPGSKPLGDP